MIRFARVERGHSLRGIADPRRRLILADGRVPTPQMRRGEWGFQAGAALLPVAIRDTASDAAARPRRIVDNRIARLRTAKQNIGDEMPRTR